MSHQLRLLWRKSESSEGRRRRQVQPRERPSSIGYWGVDPRPKAIQRATVFPLIRTRDQADRHEGVRLSWRKSDSMSFARCQWARTTATPVISASQSKAIQDSVMLPNQERPVPANDSTGFLDKAEENRQARVSS